MILNQDVGTKLRVCNQIIHTYRGNHRLNEINLLSLVYRVIDTQQLL